MADYRQLVPFILSWEGGFADVPGDRGGATNKGVTIATWQTYCKKKGIPGNVQTLRGMTTEQWMEIFKSMYWDRWKADEIKDQSLANLLVDWVWTSGAHGIKKPQALLGVKADGIVGSKTIAALNAREPKKLFKELHAMRTQFINNLVKAKPSQKKFQKGWLRRINSIQYGTLHNS